VSTDADRELSRLYRAGAREEPPAWLDETILSTAGSDPTQVHSRASVPGRRLRWQAPLALAAVLTLALSLALVVEGELEQTRASRPSMPAQVAPPAAEIGGQSEARSQPPDAAPGQDRSHEPDPLPATKSAPSATSEIQAHPAWQMQRSVPDKMERRAEERAAKRQDSPAGAAPAPPVAAASSAVAPLPPAQASREPRVESGAESGVGPRPSDPGTSADKAVESESRSHRADRDRRVAVPDAKRERAHVGDEPGRVLAQPRAGASAPVPGPQASNPARQRIDATQDAADTAMTPEQWLREIEQLRRDGQEELARTRLDQFRKRFPDYPLPESLQ